MNKKKAYVIGTNVSTSLSPVIFEHWFKKYDVDAEYGFIETKEENFNEEIKSILAIEDLVGLNVTMPFKERIIPHLTSKNNGGVEEFYNSSFEPHYEGGEKERPDHFKQLNKEIKLPINCVTIYENKAVGTNTDWIGFEKAYLQHCKTRMGEFTGGIINVALVLGYGGAGKGIVYSLVNMGFEKVIIFNRTFDKIKNINTAFEGTKDIQGCEVRAEKIENLIKYTVYENFRESQIKLIVNTTPTNPLNNHTNWNIDEGSVGFDIVYRPRKGTGFLEQFDPRCRIEGVQMLVYQAAPCFKLWFGIEPEVDEGLFNVLYKKMDKKE